MPNKSVIVSSWPLPLPPHPCCGTSHPHPASRTHRDLWVSAGAISLPVSWDWKQMAGSSSTGAHRSSKEPAPNGCNREDQPPNPITHLRRPSATPVCRPRAVYWGASAGVGRCLREMETMIVLASDVICAAQEQVAPAARSRTILCT